MADLKDDLQNLKVRTGAAWTRFQERRAARRAEAKDHPKSHKGLYWTLGITSGVVVGFVLFLGLWDWNYFKRPVENIASARTGRTVKIDGDLSVKLLSWTPTADVRGLRVSNPAWAGGGDMTKIDHLRVSVKLMPLLKGDVILPLLQADNPNIVLVRDADGRNNWTFKKRSNKPMSLPPIRRFEINDGKLAINDAKRKLVFKGVVTSSETQGASTVQAFKLLGDGTLNGAKFDMNLIGGPLLNVDPNKPYPFDAHVTAGATKIVAQGTIRKPFNLAVFDTDLSVTGDDMANLYYLTGLALPNTPPYQVSGNLARRGFVYSYTGMSGRVGGSDLRGQLSVETGRERPFLKADLKSRRLVFEDLTTVLGAGRPAGKAGSPQQKAVAANLAATQRLFPDTPLRVERIRSMDARVKYAADSISSRQFPVRRGSVNVKLDNGLLTMDPLNFGLARGELAGMVAINARKNIPAVNLDMRMTGTRVEEFLPARFEGVVDGGLVARAKLAGSGMSVRDVAAHADGQVTAVVPQGTMNKAVAELMGVNVLRYLFSDKHEETQVRCAVADFRVRDGIMNAQTIVIDTEPVILSGGGVISLKDEHMNLRVKGHPKEVRLVRLNLPLELQGTLRKPKFGVETGQAVGQAGIAAAVGTLLSPIAAILPFVSSGMADDANCKGLFGNAGAPKKAVTASNPPAPPRG